MSKETFTKGMMFWFVWDARKLAQFWIVTLSGWPMPIFGHFKDIKTSGKLAWGVEGRHCWALSKNICWQCPAMFCRKKKVQMFGTCLIIPIDAATTHGLHLKHRKDRRAAHFERPNSRAPCHSIWSLLILAICTLWLSIHSSFLIAHLTHISTDVVADLEIDFFVSM